MMTAVMQNPAIRHDDLAPRKRSLGSAGTRVPAKRFRSTKSTKLSRSTPFSPSSRMNSAGEFKAEQWFEDTNQNASRNVQFLDNDPPHFIHQSSADADSLCAFPSEGSVRESRYGKPTAPTKSLLAQMDSSRSSSDDFRNVIDDLTVKNKKLQKRLRQYEGTHCSHLEKEKLFEVRVHGLSGPRRRELEETLRSFASSLGGSSPTLDKIGPLLTQQPVAAPISSVNPHMVKSGVTPAQESLAGLRKPLSASTSYSKPIDSGYASMSGNTGPSQLPTHETRATDRSIQDSQRQQNVKSYLQDIPESLVPRNPIAMSERAKSKMVVRRLEQIFTGRGDTSSRHPHSYQQQEVSKSAAKADMQRIESMGKGPVSGTEGVREARILPNDMELHVDPVVEVTQTTLKSRQSSNDGRSSIHGDPSAEASPDQRPTRPLDLDLNRAQIPSDNVEYIRHLGLSSPKGGPLSADEAKHDWMYLNLLISLAQLHTLNVTPDFIRRAITDVSSKFELSGDGTKVRWLRGTEGTKMSPDTDAISTISREQSSDSSAAASSTIPRRLSEDLGLYDYGTPCTAPSEHGIKSSIEVNMAAQEPTSLNLAKSGNNFHYKPLFFHGPPSSDNDSSEMASCTSVSSEGMEDATAMYSGMNSGINSGSHGLGETEVKLRKYNAANGPIIFYHKARFCTDLSGDPSGAPMDEGTYIRYTRDPIGYPPHDDFSDSEQELDYFSSGAEHTQAAVSALDLEDLRSCMSELVSSPSSALQSPLSMEASGIGGVQPEDNFAVRVKVRHFKMGARPTAGGHPESIRSKGKPQLAAKDILLRNIIRSAPTSNPIESKIIAATKIDLKPSSLPSPSFAYLPCSSSSSQTSDDDDEYSLADSSHPSGESGGGIPTSPEPETKSAHVIPQDHDEFPDISVAPSESDDSDDVIDLLAHARVLDPDSVAAREREFDFHAAQPGFTKTASDVDDMSIDGDDSDDGGCIDDSD